jgi:hypothetical protein
MNTTAAAKPAEHPESSAKKSGAASRGKIHPVVIYPFQQPGDYADLEPLYRWVARLAADEKKYARPITVMDRKTYFANETDKRFLDFRQNTVAGHGKILDAWCVDTCQMWYSGLGLAFEEGREEDVNWLIPGDFNYGTPAGLEILARMHLLPEICQEQEQDVCIGEIVTSHGNSKQLIDTYGTYPLLYNWFPAEAQEIRRHTERPRSEFFAVRHGFLREALRGALVCPRTDGGDVVAGGDLPPAGQPVFRGGHFRSAGRARVPGFGLATGRTHRARAQIRLVRALPDQCWVDGTTPDFGNAIRASPADGADRAEESAGLIRVHCD